MDNIKPASRQIAQALRNVFEATPLQRNAHLSEIYGADIFLKREDLTPVRSYKIRGAFNAMTNAMKGRDTSPLFVCASAGNHAQGVAFMCKYLGVRGRIFMPVTTPSQKIMKTKTFGGALIEIRLVGDYFDETLAAAKADCESEQGIFLPPFDAEDVIMGQSTVAAEIEEQLGQAPDLIVLPVGGGGLSAGVTSYFGNEAHYAFVEPSGGACLAAAQEAGKPVSLERINSFVDGAAVAEIGQLTFEKLRPYKDEVHLQINEDRLCTTLIEMLNVEGVVLEPAGALTIDALKDMHEEIKGKTVVCIVSGSNFDFERLPEVKERAQRYSGLKKYFILRMPQRPGALKDFLGFLGPHDDITRFEYLKKSARNFGSVLIGIETDTPESFERLMRLANDKGFSARDITNDEVLSSFLV
ncbi:threonine ammonia-lyase IlvA [Lentibacter sp. XHP0401]|uniref:threonine ammonia-lyase IlvA n=1 Tax=Lentibacter sp. XHP0401 TaxID=2984334 RepID=UPI0021E6F437|nr:threonine ammonia-lyase IlvA [Lentibacter sp. XHP0401]MCV2892520.1 threonine ammonia-lyase IlvA [Lentibacter sp. XHP0401]